MTLPGAGQKPPDAALASEGAQASEASPAATKHDAPTAAGHESETGAAHQPPAASTAGDEGDLLADHREDSEENTDALFSHFGYQSPGLLEAVVVI